MEINYSFTDGDYDYHKAVNYDGTDYYNPPVTITINNIKFILGLGTSDTRKVKIVEDRIYIVGENRLLSYISMTVIDLLDNNVTVCYLQENDLPDEIFDKKIDEQIYILADYLHY